ncbi:hypothetical protein LSAT2_024512 [Lamellibrachia satsuma]|nr:hypothetical protein LSAT2_024512 [Lamellibrachia satsuma]
MSKSKVKDRRSDASAKRSSISELAGKPMSVSSSETVQPVTRGLIKSVCRNWFTVEIQQMMHGFGDCHKPLADSAALIEDIVHQQMCLMLERAEDVAKLRCARFLGLEDFLFLLRKDKVKLRRLVRHMELKDFKAATFKGAGIEEDDNSDTAAGDVKQALKKRRKICYDFLSSIDQTGELVDILSDEGIDDIKYERQQVSVTVRPCQCTVSCIYWLRADHVSSSSVVVSDAVGDETGHYYTNNCILRLQRPFRCT